MSCEGRLVACKGLLCLVRAVLCPLGATLSGRGFDVAVYVQGSGYLGGVYSYGVEKVGGGKTFIEFGSVWLCLSLT